MTTTPNRMYDEKQITIPILEYEHLKRVEKDYYSAFDIITVGRQKEKIEKLEQEIAELKSKSI